MTGTAPVGDWHWVVITGASKGFGRAVALAYTRQEHCLALNLQFTLCSRDEEGLKATQRDIEALRTSSSTEYQTRCDIVVADLSDVSSLENTADRLFAIGGASDNENNQTRAITASSTYRKQYTNIVFVNNAGSLGPLCFIGSEHITAANLADAVNLNVTSSLFLTAEFAKRFQSGAILARQPTTGSIVQQVDSKSAYDSRTGVSTTAIVVNISSLCAVQPFITWGTYCAGKAARDMFHSVLASEQKHKQEEQVQQLQEQQQQRQQQLEDTADHVESVIVKRLLVLNYAPGPLDTEMQQQIRDSETTDSTMRNMFANMKNTGQLVQPAESADKLCRILQLGLFNSGAHVDFYDELDAV